MSGQTSSGLRQRRIKRYGWVEDNRDPLDFPYAAPAPVLAELPPLTDLRPNFAKPYDQGQLGSCTAQAIAAHIQFNRRKQGLRYDWIPSRLFIYYGEREIEGTIYSDAGAMIRDGIKVVAALGVPSETRWPYVVNKFARKPTLTAYREAEKHQAMVYSRVARSLSQMKGCLAEGFPFIFGFLVYESFETAEVARSGIVPMPRPGSEALLGGHAVLAVGYDDAQQAFIVRNSWGASWGLSGYFMMPYAYLMDASLSADFWTIRLMEG